MVDAGDLDQFYRSYAEICKKGMEGLRKRDRKGRKKKEKERGKEREKKGAAAAVGGGKKVA